MTTDTTPRVDVHPDDKGNSDGPRWRRPRKLRRQLTTTLVLVAFASVALVGGLNFVAARQLLDEGTQEQLVGVGEARARSIELGIDRVLGQASALAADLAVVAALEELNSAFLDLDDEELDQAQSDELDEFYETNVVGPLNALGLRETVALADVAPRLDAARYLQYHYVATESDPGDRKLVADAGDGSNYSAVHALTHPHLAELAASLGVTDLMLISTDGSVVYSVEKRIDFGTSLATGPLSDTRLVETVLRGLSRVRIGEAVIAEQELYLPGGAMPASFVAASIRRDTEIIGALVIQIPVSALNAFTTADEQWEAVGLESGESYLVGSDMILVTESRLWIEDPDKYLRKVDDEQLKAVIKGLGSPVGLQLVDTEAVAVALDGRNFEGVTKNYLGQKTFTYSTPIDSAGVEWVMVADIPLADARGPLYDYAFGLGLVLLIILPIAAVIGLWLADRLTRPVAPVVEAALAVAGGDRDPDIPDLGKDEFGDLARRLRHMAGDLARQEASLAEEYEERRNLLLSVLPQRMVEADGAVSGTGDLVETVTAIVIGLRVIASDPPVDDDEAADLLAGAFERADELSDNFGIERVRAAADLGLFLAGVGSADQGADGAVGFALEFSAAIGQLADAAEIPLGVHIALASGTVATGLLERGNLTFAAWGEPVRLALAISALSRSAEILVDTTTVDAADEDWQFQTAHDVVDLGGDPMALFTVQRRTTPERKDV